MDENAAAEITMECWMKNLPLQLKDVPLIYLAIPGSHDSMTYGITRSSRLAPDAEPILYRLYPAFRGTILRWTITQSTDINQQLLIGIRYFDLRLAVKPNEDGFFFTHGLYAGEISEPLKQVKSFLDSHPGEVVILDFQHFYSFDTDHHNLLIKFLLDLFGSKLIPRQINLQSITLNSLIQLNQQVVIVYRHETVYSTGEFWQPQMMPSPWPRQVRTAGLISFLQNVRRSPGSGFVHQAVLTPDSTFIVLRWMSNLRKKCAIPVKRDVYPKLQELSPGPPLMHDSKQAFAPVNVVIADFVDIDDGIFAKTIVNLNLKLLKTT